ncbi:MAG TPA: YaeQ family protein [Burkholderiales bacterium]|nr:YaeQ family protein [Burkholderiales bacterium]
MALSATIYNFAIGLSDVDRSVYETLQLKVARHPSESVEYLATRVLAYCLEFAEGISFSRGLSSPGEPVIAVRDLTGVIQSWIEVGSPDAARLHKASKAAPRVALYTHRAPALMLRQLAGEKIHRAGALEIYAFEREFLAGFAARLERRVAFDLSVTDRHLFLSIGGATLSGNIERIRLDG